MRVKFHLGVSGRLRLQMLRDELPRLQPSEGASAPLVHSSVFQELTTPPKPAYRTGFGKISNRRSFGKQSRLAVQEVGAVIDRAPPSRAVFLTGTLPGGSMAAVGALAAWSGWVVQTVTQWVRDKTEGAQFFGVWEYQKRGALHLHLCVLCRSAQECIKLKTLWKQRWIRALFGVLRRSGVDVFERKDGTTWRYSSEITKTDAQTVQFSVGRYLSKYLSKGQTKNRNACAQPPSAWFFASRVLQRERRLSRRVVTVSKLQLSQALDLFERLGGLLVSQVQSVIPYQSPIDRQCKGLVCNVTPVAASLIFDYIADSLRLLEPTGGSHRPAVVPPLVVAAALFHGRVISNSS